MVLLGVCVLSSVLKSQTIANKASLVFYREGKKQKVYILEQCLWERRGWKPKGEAREFDVLSIVAAGNAAR